MHEAGLRRIRSKKHMFIQVSATEVPRGAAYREGGDTDPEASAHSCQMLGGASLSSHVVLLYVRMRPVQGDTSSDDWIPPKAAEKVLVSFKMDRRESVAEPSIVAG